jgi:centromeric protein E
MTEENITVSVRVRPMSTKELEKGHSNVWVVNHNLIQSADRSFTFDKVFHSGQSTEAVFEELGEKLVWGVMEGFNGCMFCYGQTGSGKTYTMYGVRPNFPGIVPMTVETVFAFIHETVDKEFLVRCSYLEIYNECVNDLLDSSKTNLSLRENKQGGLKILELTEKECVSISQVYSLLALGDANRQVASTNFNLKSSRSHSM